MKRTMMVVLLLVVGMLAGCWRTYSADAADAEERVRQTVECVAKSATAVYICQHDAMPSAADLKGLIEYDDSRWGIQISGTKEAPVVKVVNIRNNPDWAELQEEQEHERLVKEAAERAAKVAHPEPSAPAKQK